MHKNCYFCTQKSIPLEKYMINIQHVIDFISNNLTNFRKGGLCKYYTKTNKQNMKIVIILLLITIISCRNPNLIREIRDDNSIKEFYNDGTLKSIYEISDSLKNGKGEEYYPNGNIKCLTNWVNDTIDGQSIHFYESGMIESIKMWSNGKLHGSSVGYDEKGNLLNTKNYYYDEQNRIETKYNNGILSKLSQFTFIGDADTSSLNQYLIYDDFGNIIRNKSRYFSIFNPHIYDVVKINQPVFITLITNPLMINLDEQFPTQIKYGIFDDYYSNLDEQRMKTIFVNSYFCDLTFAFEKTGEQFIKGYILRPNVKKYDIVKYVKYEKMYFTESFYVKE